MSPAKYEEKTNSPLSDTDVICCVVRNVDLRLTARKDPVAHMVLQHEPWLRHRAVPKVVRVSAESSCTYPSFAGLSMDACLPVAFDADARREGIHQSQ